MDVKRADRFWQYIVDVYWDPETDELKITDDKNGMIDKYCADTYFDKNFIADLFEKEFVPRLPFSKLTSHQKESVEDALKAMRRLTTDEKLDAEIWKFVIKSCRSDGETISKMSASSLDWNAFNREVGSVETADYYNERLTSKLLPNLQTAQISQMNKLDVYFAFDESVPVEFLRKINSNFKVRTDNNGRLVSYQRRHVSNDEIKRRKFTPKEDSEMWDYLKKIIRNSKTSKLEKVKLTSSRWEKFVTSTKSERQSVVIHSRYKAVLRDKLHTNDFGTKEKLELHWALSIKVPAEAMKMYEATHHVELDDERFVVKFWEKTSGEKDESDTEITTDDSGSDLNDSETETTEENVETQQKSAEKRAPSDSVPEGVPDLKRVKLSGQQMSGTRLLSSLKKLIKSLPNGKYEDCVRRIDEKLALLMVEDKSIPVEYVKLVMEKVCK